MNYITNVDRSWRVMTILSKFSITYSMQFAHFSLIVSPRAKNFEGKNRKVYKITIRMEQSAFSMNTQSMRLRTAMRENINIIIK